MTPYNLGGNWLFDAGPNDQRRLQDASVAVLAQLHAIPGAAEKFGFLLPRFPGSTPLRRHVAWARDWYEFAAAGLARSALAERVLDWLEDNIPAEPEEPVLCWGDARIGNILYRDFTPAGVLDWEMATLGPRQLDLAWMIFAHRVFEHIARTYELPGMPGFLREEDVMGAYEKRTGRGVGDLTWYYLDAAVQWSVIFMRTGSSQLHFKEIEMPDQIETLFHHRGLMEEMARAAGALS
jgi:aminoglycoside phosphotransferase (APT) family kinase protein